MRKNQILKMFILSICISLFTSGLALSSVLKLEDVEPVGFSAYGDSRGDILLRIKNINKQWSLKNMWALEWSLTGEEDDFDTLITGKGLDHIILASDFSQIYFQLVNKKNNNVIEMADLVFKTGNDTDDNMWDKLMIFWSGKNRMRKTLVSALGDTDLSTMVHTPVPVPAAAWLLGSGLIGIAGFRRKFSRI
ncbi:MAG: VPLPA-CTERM sorting domain-containing protein [Desulfobacterales bacterium]|nr:VPLPA-CTERM sorting domain-containing protein [Desulfobacterales bacterium]